MVYLVLHHGTPIKSTMVAQNPAVYTPNYVTYAFLLVALLVFLTEMIAWLLTPEKETCIWIKIYLSLYSTKSRNQKGPKRSMQIRMLGDQEDFTSESGRS
jgi:hypothetical protein